MKIRTIGNEYFRQKLLAWRAELLDEANQTIANLSTESLHKPDHMDEAQIESPPHLTWTRQRTQIAENRISFTAY